jgi:AraC-like DNA-binding protein
MSTLRQESDPVLVRTFAVTLSHNQLLPPSSGDWDQLIYAKQGVLTVRTNLGSWVVPPHRAVWVPADTKSTLEITSVVALRMIYLRVSERPMGQSFDRGKCAVLSVSPLLRELILRAVQIGALKEDVPADARIAALIQDELQVVDTVPLQLPYPANAQAQRFVALMEKSFNIDAAAAACGTSRRTLERIFRLETMMSLGQWVRRRKLLLALEALARGETSESVAFRLGYNGPSAFISMFKRELGAPPRAYLALSIPTDRLQIVPDT